VPVLKEFRERLDQVRAASWSARLRRLAHLSPDDRAAIEHFSHTLLNKFLHQPTIALKEAAQAGRGYGLLEALKRLFGLERRDEGSVLVTGGAGYIGSVVVGQLLSRGHTVVVLDDLSRRAPGGGGARRDVRAGRDRGPGGPRRAPPAPPLSCAGASRRLCPGGRVRGPA